MAPNSESYSKNLFFHLGSDFVVVFLFFSLFFLCFWIFFVVVFLDVGECSQL